MKTRDLVLLACVASVAAVLAYRHYTAKPPYVAACEQYVQDKMPSPSSYKLVSYSQNIKPVAESEQKGTVIKSYMFRYNMSPDEVEQEYAEDNRYDLKVRIEMHKFTVMLTYDQMNAHGVPIRGHQGCEYYRWGSKEVSADEPAVRHKMLNYFLINAYGVLRTETR